MGAYRALRTALVDAGLKSAVKLTVPFQFGIMTATYVEEEEHEERVIRVVKRVCCVCMMVDTHCLRMYTAICH